MRHTKNETSTTTLTRLITALDKQQPVTITYTKADDTTTVRTIEIYDITVSAAGDVILKAMDRDSQESRSFRLDRLVSYSVHRTAYTVPRTAADEQPAPELATVTVLHTEQPTEEPTMTPGERFTRDMRHFLSIGPRTRRDRKGLDLHREIADWVRVAAMERGTLDPSQEESFRPTYDAACSWFKWIKLGRASYLVIEHVNKLTPYQFCALLGDMVDAEVSNTSQGGQYFERMRAELLSQAS